MSWPRTLELPYIHATTALADYIAGLPYALYLKSNDQGYSILTAQPYQRFEYSQGKLAVFEGKNSPSYYQGCPFTWLKKHLPQVQNQDFPITGGLMGYWGYELGSILEPSVSRHIDDINLPDMLLGLYDWIILINEENQTAQLIQQGLHPNADKIWQRNCKTFTQSILYSEPQSFKFTDHVESNMSYTQYQRAFSQIKHHLQQGDCYQVNLAQRFQAPIQGSYWGLFRAMQQTNPAPFSAFMRLSSAAIISCSPERFLSCNHHQIQTKPIKGTSPRSSNPTQDKLNKKSLQSSEKDRAENLMIVDLMRNDIGKVCEPGTVSVPQLFETESYTSVHHLVSTVQGKLKQDLTTLDLLKACFPGGSITGAPKISAMQKIAALELHPRHVYCGSIGYVSYQGNMDTSIAIRTGIATNGQFYFWAGGGIVIDSECEKEYQECFDKIKPFTNLILKYLSEDTTVEIG